MPNSVLLKAAGLHTFTNLVGDLPRGALVRADNVIINRDNVIEPRRGFNLYGDNATSLLKQVMSYKNKILRHYGTTIDFDNGSGTFTSFTGSFSEPETGLRIKSIESQGNLYFTTDKGIKKISSDSSPAVSDISDAGMYKALDTQLSLNSNQGFLTQDSKAAYRVIWGLTDNNENLTLGAPSERVEISAPITQLLIKDFNRLLRQLDVAAAVGGSDELADTDYFSTLNFSIFSDSSTYKTKFNSLCTKLSIDLTNAAPPPREYSEFTVNSFSDTEDNFTITAGHSFVVNNIIYFTSGSVPTGISLNTYYYIINPTSTTFQLSNSRDGDTINFTGVSSSLTLRYSQIREQGKYAQDQTLEASPTTEQLEGLQTYFNNLVSILNTYRNGTLISSSALSFTDATTSATVDLEITIPDGITENHLFQIYRTAVKSSTGVSTLSDIETGDEMGLVYESNSTTSEISAGYIRFTDITPDDFRGANLYTNPNSGEGIAQANTPPPKANDITLYKDYTFLGNTISKHSRILSLLSADSFTSGSSTFKISYNPTTPVTQTYTFVIPKAEKSSVTCVLDSANSLNGKYFLISNAKDKTNYYVWYKTSGGSLSDPAISGATGIKVEITTGDSADNVATATKNKLDDYFTDFYTVRSSADLRIYRTSGGVTTNVAAGTSGFAVSTTLQGDGEDYASKQIEYYPVQSGSITANTAVAETVVTSAAHGLTNGQLIKITGSNSTPSIDGVYVVYDITTDTFKLDTAVSVAGTAGSWDTYPVVSTSQQVDNCARSIVRVVNRNDSEAVYAYYLSGENDIPGQMYFESRVFEDIKFFFSVGNIDISGEFSPSLPATVTATVYSSNENRPNRVFYSKQFQPDAVPIVNYFDVGPRDKKIIRILALRESLFIFKEEGVYRLSGTSAPFSTQLFDSSTLLTAPDTAVVLNNTIYMLSDQGVSQTADTGVSIISRQIEGDLLKLNIPNYTNYSSASFGISYESDRSYYLFTVSNEDDDTATQCFRFNTFTNSWTRYPIAKTCGRVNDLDDKMYLGAVDINYLEKERKDFKRTDYADREYNYTLSGTVINDNIITMPSLANLMERDVLVQTQKLTITQFNRLLKKLDNDISVTDTDYYSLWRATTGCSLKTQMDGLVAKLNLDTGVADSDYVSAVSDDFTVLQNAFNTIVNKLNLDAGVFYSNYQLSSGTVEFETIIASLNADNITITTEDHMPLIQGDIIIYKHIDCDVVYAPEVIQDPSLLKQMSEATLILERSTFSEITLGFSTDLDQDSETITHGGTGNGIFGNSVYGTGPFGGNGNNVPFRTFIPRNKQRCRFINVSVNHGTAREKFAIFGLSLTANQISTRAYR